MASSSLHQPGLFDGKTFSPARDGARLESQLGKVFALMSDSKWRTIPQIVREIGWQGSDSGVSARLRDLRKEKFGSHTVNRRYVIDGLWEYSLIVNRSQ